MAKREFVQLAQTYDPDKHYVGGFLMSEKLDGDRALWDGGISRGKLTSDIPYCNTVKDKKAYTATGFWSRTGKVIHAPDWFLDKMPLFPLDGEFWMGRGCWQKLQSCVSLETPGDDWHLVEYKVYDSPSYQALFQERSVKVRNDYSFKVNRPPDSWFEGRTGIQPNTPFESILRILQNRLHGCDQVSLHEQYKLPLKREDSVKAINDFFEKVTEGKGEGIILRKANSVWTPERVHELLKHKPEHDAEGVVVGCYAGKGKYQGMMGALELEWNDVRFKISGFTDEERRIESPSVAEWAFEHPGERLLNDFTPGQFPRGSLVTFKYRELTDSETPKEARYLRKGPTV